MTAPAFIEALPVYGRFVFGSNKEGLHAGGAAAYAVERFGAEWGVGEGPTGLCYALPTMDGLSAMSAAIYRFRVYAVEHPELEFYLTEVGCGIAGHTPDEVAPFFREAPRNIHLPESFETVLGLVPETDFLGRVVSE